MVEVPGMTRNTLGQMSPHELEAFRWSLYARALEPVVSADLDSALQELTDAENPPSRGVTLRRRGEARERIAQAKIAQAAVREVLLLDCEDLDG